MGVSSGETASARRPSTFRPQKLPVDASTLALKADACHCVADAELENRYNLLRAEEHVRREGKCGPEWSYEVAERPENRSRNRYPSVVPWDHSRVILPVEDGYNDYINASWVQMGSRTYIATQGPLKGTINDFWQMVYAYGGEPAVIIMLTPLHEHSVEKCCKYWPDDKHHPLVLPQERGFKFGLTVSMKTQHKNDHYRYSSFTVTPSDKSMPKRTIHHVYYYSWLDYSKPNADADLRSLIHLVNNKLRNRASPPIVHCSAGIGRTGTFIAIDALLTRIDTDILPTVIPRVIPVWKGSQKVVQFRASLFTGAEDMHVESDSNSPLLSKFDVAQASSVTPSIHSRPTTTQTTPNECSFLPQNGEKRPITNNTGVHHSLLTEAIMKRKNSTLRTENDGGMSTAEENSEGFTEATSLQTPVDSLHDDSTPIPSSSPPLKSSALSGPQIRKVAANITSVSPEVFSETPHNIDVMGWYDPNDPVMSAIRTMRKQRPKMVQGKQQLGYIYDQFEVGQQLARATHQPNQTLTRRATIDSSSPMSTVSEPATHLESHHHRHHFHHHFPKPGRLMSMVGLRRSSTSSAVSETETSSGASFSQKKRGLFHGSVLK